MLPSYDDWTAFLNPLLEILHRSNPIRFEHEISRLAGTHGVDLSNSFNVMLESVEVTALQRGCLRWEP